MYFVFLRHFYSEKNEFVDSIIKKNVDLPYRFPSMILFSTKRLISGARSSTPNFSWNNLRQPFYDCSRKKRDKLFNSLSFRNRRKCSWLKLTPWKWGGCRRRPSSWPSRPWRRKTFARPDTTLHATTCPSRRAEPPARRKTRSTISFRR